VARENAVRKARIVARKCPGRLVLGVDTLVWAAGTIYGKPVDRSAAGHTLRRLSGIRHTVFSGLCLAGPQPERERVAEIATGVRFRELGDDLIDWYLASGEWRERAGGYAIQGRGGALVAGIDGDYLNVVGLPLVTLLELEPALLRLP
jgi:septum formation protein